MHIYAWFFQPTISSTIGSSCRDRNREILDYALATADQYGMWIYVSEVVYGHCYYHTCVCI